MADPKLPPISPLNPNDPGASGPDPFPNRVPPEPIPASQDDVVERIRRDHAGPGWTPAGYRPGN